MEKRISDNFYIMFQSLSKKLDDANNAYNTNND